jgi:hypothetical protein
MTMVCQIDMCSIFDFSLKFVQSSNPSFSFVNTIFLVSNKSIISRHVTHCSQLIPFQKPDCIIQLDSIASKIVLNFKLKKKNPHLCNLFLLKKIYCSAKLQSTICIILSHAKKLQKKNH